MNRRWFAQLNSIVLSVAFASSAAGQNTTQSPTLGDRMSALRQNRSQTTDESAAEQSAPVANNSHRQSNDNQSGEGHSFLPKWFGRRNDNSQMQPVKQPTQNNKRMASANGQQPNAGTMPRVASRTPVGTSTQSQPNHDRYALPGLGGSPLPRSGPNSPKINPTSNQGSGNPGATASTGSTSAQSAVPQPRANGSPSSVAGRKQQVAAPQASSAPTTATRHSPNRRAAPIINPNDLRRELAGSFPEPVATDPHAPRVAQAGEPKTQQGTTQEPTPTVAPANDLPATAVTRLALPTVAQPTVASAANPEPTAETSSTTPAAASPPNKSNTESISSPNRAPSVGTSNFVRVPRSISDTTVEQSARGKEAFGEALQVASGGDPSVLVSNQTPVLSIDIRGPKQILIGRESIYRIKLQNQSDFAAEGIVASVRIPAWADVVNSTATQGMVQQTQDGSAPGPLQWQLARVERRGSETLEVRLVPRESKPLELGVSWTLAPVGSRTVVEVQEPKLKLEVAGPNEVLFDKPQTFQLTISNPGTGLAENVKIDLIPPGASQQDAATSHQLGDLAPGASQSVEVELTARDAGKMFVKAVASAEGGLTCDATKEIFCRKPELEVDWRGPATKYAGTPATYFFRVRNPGTAPADDVEIKINLPEGAEFTSASDGQVFDAQRREVSWRVGTLAPGDDNYMELKCLLKNSGTNQFKITAATAKGELSDSKTAETNVVAIADLKLDVTDPSGPVAVGSQAVYEIHVQNSGSNSAKEVNVVALFSDGIEPEQAEGAMYTVADGRVSFKTIDELPAGRDIVLRIRAHAVQPGTHIFRAEVLCRDLEIKLAAEETTRFYADDVTPDGDGTQQKSASRSDAFRPSVR